MIELHHIFAVIDPTTDNQIALRRAARIARIASAEVHAWLCVHSTLETADPASLRRVETARYECWLEETIEPVRAEGIRVTPHLKWDADWRDAMAPAAAALHSDLIVKSSHRRTVAQRIMRTSSDLRLFATANCPVLLVTSDAVDDPRKVLIAVDPHRTDERYTKICNAVVDYGKAAAASVNGELHVVYAYEEPHDYVHVSDVARLARVDASRTHVFGGEPEQVIARVARDIGAGLIVIGLSTKSSLASRAFGYTAEALLNNLDHDILVVIPREERVPLPRVEAQPPVFPLAY